MLGGIAHVPIQKSIENNFQTLHLAFVTKNETKGKYAAYITCYQMVRFVLAPWNFSHNAV
jgi:hypothetical protein